MHHTCKWICTLLGIVKAAPIRELINELLAIWTLPELQYKQHWALDTQEDDYCHHSSHKEANQSTRKCILPSGTQHRTALYLEQKTHELVTRRQSCSDRTCGKKCWARKLIYFHLVLRDHWAFTSITLPSLLPWRSSSMHHSEELRNMKV